MTVTSLHVFLTPARYESRFLREATALIRSGLADRVILLALWDHGLAESESSAQRVDIQRVRLRSRGLPRLLPFQLLKGVEWRRQIVARAKAVQPSCIVAHSLGALPAAAAAARAVNAPLLYDVHELETERNGVRGLRQALDRVMERALIRRAGAVLCVSDSIADWYAGTYGIARPAVVRNIPDARWQGELAGSRVLRDRFGLADADLLFIYQGGLFPGRRIGQLLRVFERVQLDRHVVFMGYGELEPEVRAAAAARANVHFLPAVPPAEVLRHTASADVGLTGVENVCLSYYYSLPNKLFEYLAAGLPFLVPAYPEMQRLVERHACGWVVGETDDEWVALIDGLTRAEIATAKEAARTASPQYSWANEEAVLLGTYRHLLRKHDLRV